MELKKTLLSILLLTVTVILRAQDAPEYRAEIGGGVGMVTYLGDYNGNLFKNMQPMFSLLGRYKFNPRMALALNVSYGKIKGSSKDAKTVYPDVPVTDFNHGLVDAGLRFEYNFWPYGTGREYRGAQRVTPYIYMGLGLTFAKPEKTETALNLPIGAGSDMLDGVKDPYGIKSSGFFKNTDCYSHLRLSVTYDIWKKCSTCHNDRE